MNQTRQKAKAFLKKNLPGFAFRLVLKIWRATLGRAAVRREAILFSKFTSKTVKEVSFSGVNYKIIVTPENGCVDKHIWLNSVYEPEILSLIAREIKKGDTFLDIGANIGQHSLFTSHFVGDSGKVISFEPIKKIYGQFRESIDLNGFANITAHNLACGNESKKSEIYLNSGNMGGSSLVCLPEKENYSGKEETTVVRLDDFLPADQRIDLIKMDVEGYEYEALQGMKGLLIKNKPKMIMEFSPCIYNQHNPEHSELILGFIKELGYRIYDIRNDSQEIADFKKFISDLAKGEANQTDIFCLPI